VELLLLLQPRWLQQEQRPLRIIVFIDDLGRCKPSKVVEVLEAVNLVLGPSGFTVVAGMVSWGQNSHAMVLKSLISWCRTRQYRLHTGSLLQTAGNNHLYV
jgi:hypothetical protein